MLAADSTQLVQVPFVKYQLPALSVQPPVLLAVSVAEKPKVVKAVTTIHAQDPALEKNPSPQAFASAFTTAAARTGSFSDEEAEDEETLRESVENTQANGFAEMPEQTSDGLKPVVHAANDHQQQPVPSGHSAGLTGELEGPAELVSAIKQLVCDG